MKAADLTTFLANPSAGLPRRIPLARLSEQISRSHFLDGGATFNPRFGSLVGQSLFAVSLYPDRSVIVAGRSLTPERIVAFALQNSDLLRDPRNCIGTWYDEDYDVTYLDVTAVVTEKPEALMLGARYNQVGIYDLAGAVEIPTGGTGNVPEDAPTDTERLPPLTRRRRKGSDATS